MSFAPCPFPPLELFDREHSVLSTLAKKPAAAPGATARKLFPKAWFGARLLRRVTIKRDLLHGRVWTEKELDQAAERGNFPYRPSDLFLNMYADVLTCLSRRPLAGNVSPALLGTSGTIPLSIVSTIPDIMRHYYDTIVLAEKEVFLVTNYWQPSDSVKAVSQALKDLSVRVGKRGGDKIVVKIMWDRGAFEQLIRNHAFVSEETWVGLDLPANSEVPNLSLEVINFHKPLLGTFHQKALVVDRKVALLNSNNIQDRPNVEMMVHLEGPVVDSIYDVLLLSWNEKFTPVLPCVTLPAVYPDPKSGIEFPYTFADANPFLETIDVTKAAKAARRLLSRQYQDVLNDEPATEEHPIRNWFRRGSGDFDSSTQTPPPSSGVAGGFASLVTGLVQKMREEKAAAGGGGANESSPLVFGEKAKGPAFGSSSDTTVVGGDGSASSTPAAVPPIAVVTEDGTTAAEEGTSSLAARRNQDDLALSMEDNVKSTTGPESPSFLTPSAPASPGATDPERPPVARDDSRLSNLSIKSSARLAALSKALNAGALAKVEATIDDESLIDDFKPHMIHKAHKPFPIAMVNRGPHGSPGHQDIRVAQDAAWLAGFRYANDNVFIQTPTLNAKPIVRAIIEACTSGGRNKTGLEVTLFLDLGFNDKGESIPWQGGTNEEVVLRLYDALRPLKKEHNLNVYWYTGKDQMKPLNAVHKTRNCHVKFMSIDHQCAIVGNGNQDTQSWFHSQECNILIDSAQIVLDWEDQLRTNQSTHTYGKVDTDGIWRDPKTKEPLQPPQSISCFTAISAMNSSLQPYRHPARRTLAVRLDLALQRIPKRRPLERPAAVLVRFTNTMFTASSTTFVLQAGGVNVTAVFLSPNTPNDLTRQSLPYSYLTVTTASNDGKAHAVSLYSDIDANWVSPTNTSVVNWSTGTQPGNGSSTIIRHEAELTTQTAFAESNEMANNGQVVYATANTTGTTWQTGAGSTLRATFAATGILPNTQDAAFRAIGVNTPAFGFASALGTLSAGGAPSVAVTYVVGHYRDPAVHLQKQATSTVSADYAGLAALATRQVYSGLEITIGRTSATEYNTSDILAWTKEIATSDYISTVDVNYPVSWFFAYANPKMIRYIIEPVLQYTAKGLYQFPYVLHDLGKILTSNSKTGDMMVLAYAHAKLAATNDLIKQYYPTLLGWAAELASQTLYPASQVSTDDFAGAASNYTSLALKGLCGIQAMAKMAALVGETADAANYSSIAKSYAKTIQQQGLSKDGSHWKVTYQSDDSSWISAYNLFPDQALGLDLYPSSLYTAMGKFYPTVKQPYGVPLDSRGTTTKSDWALMTAAMHLNAPATRDAFVSGVLKYQEGAMDFRPFPDRYDSLAGGSNLRHWKRPIPQ
ncbi:hypothetical protein RQP46_006551 [Phenoliferia psychrophenolica]